MYLLIILFQSREKYLSFYKPYRRIINISIGLLLISLIVLIAGMGSGALFYRVLAMIFFPIALLLPYLNEEGVIKRRTFNNLFTLYVFITELQYLKDLYYAYAGGRF